MKNDLRGRMPCAPTGRGARRAPLIIIALLLLAACAKKDEGESQPIVSVRVARAEIAPIAQPIELAGTIAARQEAGVGSKISGAIVQMALLKNRAVRAGEVLARIEARDVAAQ
ncbi:MAG TPA: hypothetical protein VI670_05935, partial [Thermoanaerobaculia bacterium]